MQWIEEGLVARVVLRLFCLGISFANRIVPVSVELMPGSLNQKLGNHRGKSAASDVQGEVKAMKAAFRRVSGSKQSVIKFLSKAGIVTPEGQLTTKYR